MKQFADWQHQLRAACYSVGTGIIALKTAVDQILVCAIYTDSQGILRVRDSNAALLPLPLTHTSAPGAPLVLPQIAPTVTQAVDVDWLTEAVDLKTLYEQAIEQRLVLERRIAEINAVMEYGPTIVQMVRQREADGWRFESEIPLDMTLLITQLAHSMGGTDDRPKVWILSPDMEGRWRTCLPEEQAGFERIWGLPLTDAQQQQILGAAAVMYGG